MFRRVLLFCSLVVVGLVFVSACNDDPSGPDQGASDIRGRVVNGQGEGVEGVGILMCYGIDWSQMTRGKPATQITYSVPVAAEVRLWITEPCHNEIVRTLVDGFLPAGQGSVTWDSRNDAGLYVTEGQYLVHLEADTTSWTREIFLGIVGYSGLLNTDEHEVFATTDEDGSFNISQECLDFGAEIVYYNDSLARTDTLVVPRRVSLWAVHEDYGLVIGPRNEPVFADTGARIDIFMDPPLP